MSWKSENLNLLEPSGPHRAGYETALPYCSNYGIEIVGHQEKEIHCQPLAHKPVDIREWRNWMSGTVPAVLNTKHFKSNVLRAAAVRLSDPAFSFVWICKWCCAAISWRNETKPTLCDVQMVTVSAITVVTFVKNCNKTAGQFVEIIKLNRCSAGATCTATWVNTHVAWYTAACFYKHKSKFFV
jgi:hypothetical protein